MIYTGWMDTQKLIMEFQQCAIRFKKTLVLQQAMTVQLQELMLG